jgi:hypothetical protein
MHEYPCYSLIRSYEHVGRLPPPTLTVMAGDGNYHSIGCGVTGKANLFMLRAKHKLWDESTKPSPTGLARGSGLKTA